MPQTSTRKNTSNVENAIATRSYHAVPPPVTSTWNYNDITRHTGRHPQATSSKSNGQGNSREDSMPSAFGSRPLNLSGDTIEYSSDYLQAILSLVFPTETLQKHGYILQNLSEEDLNGKKRCQGCGISMHKFERNRRKELTADQKHRKVDLDRSTPTKAVETSVQGSRSEAPAKDHEPVYRCKYHPGEFRLRMWSCCRKPRLTDPCSKSEFHVPKQYPVGQLESLWKFYTTPDAQKSDIRPVVAIDCEMGTSETGDSELIRITLIDYFSSAVLVDSLVYPDVKIANYNTRFSGVTRGDMENSLAKGKCLRGKKMAREAVWRFVGRDTVVVGHSANNDLTAMRWIHEVVVDTFILEFKIAEELKAAEGKEKEKEEEQQQSGLLADGIVETILKKDRQAPQKRQKGSGKLTLKTLSMSRLEREIQTKGKKGHDSLEDAVAARDLAHWHVMKLLDSPSSN